MDAQTAAAVAKRHGLTLSDANALKGLCETEQEADALAAQFVGEPSTDDVVNEILSRTGRR